MLDRFRLHKKLGQSVTKLFGQNTYLDFISPLPPNTMLITAIKIFSSSTMTSTVNVISPKATLLGGRGGGTVQNWNIHWKINRRHFFVSARRPFVTDCSFTSLKPTRYFITKAFPTIAVLVVMVIVIFIIIHDIIIVAPVVAILKATEVSPFQAICHAGAWWKLTGPAALATDNSSRTAFGAGRPPIQSIASLPSSVHQPHPRGEGISGHRWRLRFQIAA